MTTPLPAAFATAGLDWLVADWPAPPTVCGFATTRNGGVGTGERATLDLGPARLEALATDVRADVLENRRRVARWLPAAPVWLEQVHGREVAIVDAPDVVAMRSKAPVADAAVTRLAGVPLAVRVADCLPVLFTDDAGSVVAVAHAGWRGLAAGVLEATLEAMAVAPRRVLAWLGPAIGRTAFEVGGDVRDAFRAAAAEDAECFVPLREGKWLADLPALARRRLARAGVVSVGGDSPCTFTDAARFFSWRRDRSPGRMAAIVWRGHDGEPAQ